MNNNVKWSEQHKIRPRKNASIKHEVIKLLVVLNLIEKYKKDSHYIRIYTEFQAFDKKICDVYFENQKSKEIVCYEIQKNISQEWLDETSELYDNWNNMFFKTDWCLIKEKDFSENIEEINKKIKELII
jgi:hypothetical protein